jgi:hypothetical protein
MNRTLRIALPTALAIGLLASTQVAAHAQQSDDTATAASNSRIGHVSVTMIDTPGRSGSNGIIPLRMGKSAPIKVMVDTGSVGLRLWSAPKAVAAKATTRTQTPLDGSVVPARLGTSRITLGGLTTTAAVPFALIDSSSAYIDAWKRAGVSGILGIGIGAASGTGSLTNPLRSLPNRFGQQWSLHFAKTGSFILGAQPPADAQMHFPLPTAGVDANGVPLWNDKAAPGCWRFGLRTRAVCPHKL